MGKDVPGCVTSKHICKEDNDFEITQGKTKSNFCTSCKEVGHIREECPKDPNARTKFPPVEELDRIKTNQRRKHKTAIVNSEIQEKVIQILEPRLEGSQFANPNNETSNDEIEENGDMKGFTFKDLFLMKEEITFNQEDTKIKIELQKRQTSRRSTRKQSAKSFKSMRSVNFTEQSEH